MEVLKLKDFEASENCLFCRTSEADEVKYGPIYRFGDIIVHYYCLLLSPNLIQNGKTSEEGLLGFLAEDIRKEIRRGERLACTFCKRKGAVIGCSIKRCSVKYHLPCGLKHGTSHQFCDEFKSFCKKHKPTQNVCPEILKEAGRDLLCTICQESMDPCDKDKVLWAPCCQKNAFFHRVCIQKLALSAGYLFKCPLCNNIKIFTQEMETFGIYIPKQDASWEQTPNAYADLLERHRTCDSQCCKCPAGRKINAVGTKWELFLCHFCGSQGVHLECGKLNPQNPEFTCVTCSGEATKRRKEEESDYPAEEKEKDRNNLCSYYNAY